jgi:hypothetical protein
MWKFGLIAVIATISSLLSSCGAFANENRNVKNRSTRYTIEELLSSTFPYTDPRMDHQLDMDPCKSGKAFVTFRCAIFNSTLSLDVSGNFFLIILEHKTIFLLPVVPPKAPTVNDSQVMFNFMRCH